MPFIDTACLRTNENAAFYTQFVITLQLAGDGASQTNAAMTREPCTWASAHEVSAISTIVRPCTLMRLSFEDGTRLLNLYIDDSGHVTIFRPPSTTVEVVERGEGSASTPSDVARLQQELRSMQQRLDSYVQSTQQWQSSLTSIPQFQNGLSQLSHTTGSTSYHVPSNSYLDNLIPPITNTVAGVSSRDVLLSAGAFTSVSGVTAPSVAVSTSVRPSTSDVVTTTASTASPTSSVATPVSPATPSNSVDDTDWNLGVSSQPNVPSDAPSDYEPISPP